MFRKILFWAHLAAGVIAGLVIAMLCVTGTLITFEKEIIAWAEHDLRSVATPTNGAPAIPLETLLKQVSAKEPERSIASITLFSAPQSAIALSFGRDFTYYADPATGEVKGPAASGTRTFMHQMTAWHRWFGVSDEPGRSIGKGATGAANLVFLFLALSGLYLWWPRHWSKRGVRAIAVINLNAAGRARDHNWHLSLGLWTAPLLIVLTATAIPISYRWGHALVYQLVGEEAPARGGGPGAASRLSPEVPAVPPATPRLGWDALAQQVAQTHPTWSEMTFRLGGGPGAGQGAGAGAGRGQGARQSGAGRADRSEGPSAIQVTVRTAEQFPAFGTTTLALDPHSGAILAQETFADQTPGRRLRSWLRYLHTGEALGVGGKAVAGLASAVGVLLVWTGLALTWRRFFSRPATHPLPQAPSAQGSPDLN